MEILKRWGTAIIFTLAAIVCLLAALLFLKSTPGYSLPSGADNSSAITDRGQQHKVDPKAKPGLPIEARFVSISGKYYLKITPRTGSDLEGELAVEITKWTGAGSKFESTTTRLIKKDGSGVYLETPPNPRVVPDYYVYRIHLPQLFYNIGIYGGTSWRVYSTYLPGDIVQIQNSLCEPIVLECPLKVSEQSDIAADTKGKVDFIRK